MAIIYTTFPTKDIAKQVAETLVREGIVACVNIFEINSIYYWEGSIHSEPEVGVFLKTKIEVLERAIKRLEELHPYSAPAILVSHWEIFNKEYEKWLMQVVRAD